ARSGSPAPALAPSCAISLLVRLSVTIGSRVRPVNRRFSPIRYRPGAGGDRSEVEVRHRLAGVGEALQAAQHLPPAEGDHPEHLVGVAPADVVEADGRAVARRGRLQGEDDVGPDPLRRSADAVPGEPLRLLGPVHPQAPGDRGVGEAQPQHGPGTGRHLGPGRPPAGDALVAGERLPDSLTVGGDVHLHQDLPPGSTTVEIDLFPDGDGTVLRPVHRDLPGPATEAHRWGWDHYTARLPTAAPR